MTERQPTPITAMEHQGRISSVSQTARSLGFVGHVDYRHVYSRTGGAQYGIGATIADDLLVVYAEAFERDANSEDFSLTASEALSEMIQRGTPDAKAVRLVGQLRAYLTELL